MNTLTPHESRILGVLVEKALTTPAQYPMTLNGLLNGCNQKSNRDPVLSLSEDDILAAVDSLRVKGFIREVMLSGSRVEKFKQVAREALEIDTNQLVVLTELLLRGPQTLGEIRGRASRMTPLESTDIVRNILESLMQHDPPLARKYPPPPGSRSAQYGQLLCPDLHPVNEVHAASPTVAAPAPARADNTANRLEALETEVAILRGAITRLAQEIGANDPLDRRPPAPTP